MKLDHIKHELTHHAPFTATGAILGVLLLIGVNSAGLSHETSARLFETFHPLHVLFSAIATTGLYRIYMVRKNGQSCIPDANHIFRSNDGVDGAGTMLDSEKPVSWPAVPTCSSREPEKTIRNRCDSWLCWGVALLIGFVGSVGIGTLSDCLIPFWGESLLARSNEHVHAHMHIGFIEQWYIVNPAALLGAVIGITWPRLNTGGHAIHVLLSTTASLFHLHMAINGSLGFVAWCFLTLFLFIAVWVPCCTSDIVFPALLVGDEKPKKSEVEKSVGHVEEKGI